ncbi:MAG: hypothetical protein K0B11_22215 [Mariniphaga sp.]|nr:hypothetical protein [Mariniphaga sp.]
MGRTTVSLLPTSSCQVTRWPLTSRHAKNQKACPAPDGYSKEETCPPGRRVYLAIEFWQESGLYQSKFCSRENLSVKTFSYWYRKYKKGKGLSVEENKETPDIFIPVKVSGDRTTTVGNESYGRIVLCAFFLRLNLNFTGKNHSFIISEMKPR